LLDLALKQGQNLEYKCKKGTCGKCKVQVIAGSLKLYSPNEKEFNSLNDEVRKGFRLTCQAKVFKV
jgi:2Fe-2S ferredoxin